MEAKIIKTLNFKDNTGAIFHNYQVYHNLDKIWVSELTFSKYPGLIQVQSDCLILKEPVNEYYFLEKKKNKNGEFLALLPLQNVGLADESQRVKKPEEPVFKMGISSDKGDKILAMIREGVKNTRMSTKLENYSTGKQTKPAQEQPKPTTTETPTFTLEELGVYETKQESLAEAEPNITNETDPYEEANEPGFSDDDPPEGAIKLTAKEPQEIIGKLNFDTVIIADDSDVFIKSKDKEIEFPMQVNENAVEYQSRVTAKQRSDSLGVTGRKQMVKFTVHPKPALKGNIKTPFESFLDLHGATRNIANELTSEEKQDIIDEFGNDFTDQVFPSPTDISGQPKHQPSNIPNFEKHENKGYSSNEKLSFINGLINLSNKRNVDEKTKERLFGLIGKELGKTGTVEEEILREVRGIREGLEGFTINKNGQNNESNKILLDDGKINEYLQKIEYLLENYKDIYENINPYHRPQLTYNFLKSFKTDEYTKETYGAALKLLVHKPLDDENYSFYEHLNQVFEIKYFKDLTELSQNEFLPIRLYKQVLYLIKDYISEGYKTFTKTGKHPYSDVSSDYRKTANNFKKSYRFDVEGSESTPISSFFEQLQKKFDEENKNIFTKTFGEKAFNFLPTKKLLDNNAVFFAYIPQIRIFMLNIMDDLIKHSSNRNSKKDSTIEVSFMDEQSQDGKGFVYSLSIVDIDSASNKSPERIYEGMKDRMSLLRSVCDWSVKYQNSVTGSSHQVDFLTYDFKNGNQRFKEIEKCKGFTHILKFYDL